MRVSEELLSEVLGINVLDCVLGASTVSIFYKEGDDTNEGIWNVYELVHKCKEWAVSKGYTLVEAPLMLRITRLCTNQNKIWDYTLEEQNNGEYFKPEYTFKACEWIMKESKDAHE